MADSKVSALTAASAALGAMELPVNDAGTSKKLTVSQIAAYVDALRNGSVAAQAITAATDTYITGSNIAIPTARMQAGAWYRLMMHVTKTAAGTVAPAFNVRYGTAGAIGDTSRCLLTMGAQTATANSVWLTLFATFRIYSNVGVLVAGIGGSIAGFPVAGATVTSSTFDMTVASSKIGVSVNSGTSAAWTINQAQAELLNIVD